MKDVAIAVGMTLEAFLADVSRAIWTLRAPAVVSLVAFWILSHEQVQEAYVRIANNAKAGPVVWAGLSILLLTSSLLLVGYEAAERDGPSKADTGAFQHALRFLPAVFALLPLAGLVWGLLCAKQPMESYAGYQRLLTGTATQSAETKEFLANLTYATRDARRTVSTLEVAVYCSLTVGLAVFAVMLWRGHELMRAFRASRIRVFSGKAILGLTLLGSASIILVSVQTHEQMGWLVIDVVRSLGSVFVVGLFLTFLAWLVTVLVLWRDRRGVPILALLVVLAVVSSCRNWNDNHVVELKTFDNKSDKVAGLAISEAKAMPPLPVAFFDWFDRRPESRRCAFSPASCPSQVAKRADSVTRPYPVYIVAAEGGGMYAAELASIALARLYDRCPALRHHIFAVSGVSGGSFGAGVFAAILNSQARAPGASGDTDACELGSTATQRIAADPATRGGLESKMVRVLSDDFLTPLGAAALFPDLFQRFFPYPIAAFDRARAFEASLERTWETQIASSGPNALRAGFLSHWHADGNAPMLVLNTTSVQTGQPVLVAPFITRSLGIDYGGELSSLYERFVDKSKGKDVSMSAAIGLSARFPIILPGGSFFDQRGRRFALADGGYFENSGVETALLMIRDLQFFTQHAHILKRGEADAGKANYRDVEFRLLVLNGWGGKPVADEGLSEALTPVRALYRARVQRGEIAISRAQTTGLHTRVVRFDHELFSLPLGWQLSDQTSRVISLQISRPEWCIEDESVMKTRLGNLQQWLARNPPVAGQSGLRKLEQWLLGGRSATVSAADDNKQLRTLFRLRNDNACALHAVLSDVKL